MNSLETTVRGLKVACRLTSRSPLVTSLRLLYDLILRGLYGQSGLPRTLNDDERILVDPAHRYVPEDYEPSVYAHLRDLVRPGAVVLDVGAHIGLFAIILARWAGTSGKVFAFEPTHATRLALARHLVLNGVADRVEVLGAAVSDRVGTAPFSVVAASPENTLNAVHSRLGPAASFEVPVTTVDAFCEARGIAPTLLKIDIEGFEWNALRGAERTLLRHRPAVVLELHPMIWGEIGESAAAGAALLERLGYRPVPLDGQADVYAEYGHVALELT